MKRTLNTLLILGAILFLFGCSHTGVVSQQGKGSKGPSVTQVAENPAGRIGSYVYWGGVIRERQSEKDQTTIKVANTPIGFSGRPKGLKHAKGEFLAKTTHLDPDVYTVDALVSLGGTVSGMEPFAPDGSNKTYPVVAIQEIELFGPDLTQSYGGRTVGFETVPDFVSSGR